MKAVKITSEYITLGQFLKFQGIISNGGETKDFLANHAVFVNGEAENRRGKKLYPGDLVKIEDMLYKVC